MIGLDVALACCLLVLLVTVVRVVQAPTPADRVVAAELLTVAVIGSVALAGTRFGVAATLELVLILTLAGFLAAVSLARGLTGGAR